MPTRQEVIEAFAGEFDRIYVSQQDADRFDRKLHRYVEEESPSEAMQERLFYTESHLEVWAEQILQMVQEASIPPNWGKHTFVQPILLELIPLMTVLTTGQKNALITHLNG